VREGRRPGNCNCNWRAVSGISARHDAAGSAGASEALWSTNKPVSSSIMRLGQASASSGHLLAGHKRAPDRHTGTQ
jgi:hypothetical protein